MEYPAEKFREVSKERTDNGELLEEAGFEQMFQGKGRVKQRRLEGQRVLAMT